LGNLSFSQEPAVWIGLLTAIIDAAAVFFPTKLSADQKVVLIGLVTTLVPLALSFVVRQNVTPVAPPPVKTP